MRMPAQLVERARAIVYGGEWTPPPARPAATVVLLRDNDGIEVALLQRAASLAFAHSMYVFPGGALDPADEELGDPWLIAAIRETFEEAGVLLTDPPAPVAACTDRDRPFPAILSEYDLRPAASALHRFAHWVTPEVESRRFDTRFYAAELPAGQDLSEVTSEHQNIGWYRPASAMDLPMLPPTAAVLAELSGFDRVADVLSVVRDPVPIMPHPVARDGDVDWVLINAATGEPL